MASNVYECMFLLDTNKVAGDVKNADKTIRGIFDRNGIEVLAARPWDERRLAYSIGKHKKGLYFLTYFNAEGTKLANLKRDFALNEMILRHMILKIHPKMVDTMLTLAKDEHALALQMIRDDSADEGGYGGHGGRGEGRGDGGHRRHGGGGRRHGDGEDKG
ncbi:MAG: 30S ribosomal protein S6 [Gemmataceae bacterium]|nr:30S ribosomal protein S6 [Gemmataceae bacterium]